MTLFIKAKKKLNRESDSLGRRDTKSVTSVCFFSGAMEDFRSKSCGNGKLQIESYHGIGNVPSGGISGMQDLRCYSTSSVPPTQTQNQVSNDLKLKKGKSRNGSTSKSWSFSDPELQRKKRVASYKVYGVEGKVKGSLRKSFRWLKERCTRVISGC